MPKAGFPSERISHMTDPYITREEVLAHAAVMNVSESTLNGTSVAAKAAFMQACGYARASKALTELHQAQTALLRVQAEVLQRQIAT